MRCGSLFSGIGGLDLGLERAGMEIVWQVENDEWCSRVLERHWPHVARFRDVRDCHGPLAHPECEGLAQRQALRGNGAAERSALERGCLETVDLICGGFPCQPVSHAGRRMGESDSRWLWPEFYRIICEVRPRWVLAENVPGLLSMDSGRLFGGILRDLSEAGYDAVWFVLSAADVGAPHLRERVFVVAHASSGRQRAEQRYLCAREPDASRSRSVANAEDDGQPRGGGTRAGRAGLEDGGWWTTECRLGIPAHGLPDGLVCGGWECGVPRVIKGQKDRVNRLRGLGNSVVPQVAEAIGRWIIEAQ